MDRDANKAPQREPRPSLLESEIVVVLAVVLFSVVLAEVCESDLVVVVVLAVVLSSVVL